MERSASVQAFVESVDAPVEENSEPACPDSVPSDEPGDIERLFPDPHVRELLDEIAGDLRRVARFVQRIDKELKTEKVSISETNLPDSD
jgi:hypothetical protein